MKRKELIALIESEGDRHDFEYRGFKCFIVRCHWGHLCGYVEVDEFSGVPDDVNTLDVHGGITFDRVVDGKRTIGFDCAHLGDCIPGYHNGCSLQHFFIVDVIHGAYKDLEFVKSELKKLVTQLLET